MDSVPNCNNGDDMPIYFIIMIVFGYFLLPFLVYFFIKYFKRKYCGLEAKIRRELDGVKRDRDYLRRRQQDEKELEEIKKERDDFQMRLNALGANSPELVDMELPDMSSPDKLAESFNELFYTQWNGAFRAAVTLHEETRVPFNDKDVIRYLLDILKETFEFCQAKTSRILEWTRTLAEQIGYKDDVLLNTVLSKRRFLAPKKVPDPREVMKNLKKRVGEFHWVGFLDDKAVQDYVKECTIICWVMQAQIPPMTFAFVADDKDPETFFRPYKHNGNHVDFVVWPRLLHHEGGPILSHGVVKYN